MKRSPFPSLLAAATLILLAACQIPTSTTNDKSGLRITSVGWVSENIDLGFWSTPPDPVSTSFYDFWIGYEGTVQLSDVSEVRITASNGVYWLIPLNTKYFNASKKYFGGWGRWYDGGTPHQLPIGPFVAAITLKNGTTVSSEVSIPAPGAAQAGSWTTMHTENFTGSTSSSSSMVRRATLDSGLVLNTTNQTAQLSFSVSDTKAYNGQLEFYTTTGTWVGTSPLFRNLSSSGTSTIASGFQTSGASNVVTIASSDITYATGRTFSDITKALVVLMDGGQYTQTSTTSPIYDCLSISAWAIAGGGGGGGGTETIVVNAGADQNAFVGNPVSLQGSATGATTVSYSWILATRPSGSTASLSDPTSATPSFTPDKSGAYRFTVEATGQTTTSPSDEVVVYVSKRRIATMPANIVASAYDTVRDRIVIVSSAPNKVTLLDPVQGTSESTSLAYAPTCLGLSSDNNRLAVGHSGSVSVVDISATTPVLLNTWPLTGGGPDGYTGTVLKSVAYGDTGHIFCFPTTDQWIDLRIIAAETGVQTFYTGGSMYAGAVAKLAPSGDSIYYFDAGLSPSDLHWIAIGTVPLPTSSSIDSKYHGDYPIGGASLWFDESYQVVVGTGSVFSATESGLNTTDMQYVGSLASAAGNLPIKSLSHRVAASWGTWSSLYALIPTNDGWSSDTTPDTNVVLATASDFGGVVTLALPLFVQSSVGTRGHGYETWWNSAGSELYVLMKSDGATNASDWDLVVF